MRSLLQGCVLLLLACGPTVAPVPPTPPLDEVPSLRGREQAPPHRVVLSVIGTNDLHGHLETLPTLAGYLANVRAARAQDGGVLLVDGGDMWQGTLASNMAEGAPVVAAYNVLRYDAAAIGNHEFDYGPVGPAATPQAPSDDPRGALLARVREATFSVLGANYLDATTGEPVSWPGVRRSVLLERAGVRVGIVGVGTIETPSTTIAANVRDVRMAPLAPTIETLARRLRADGAHVVVVVAHAGAECRALDDPDDLSSCDRGEVLAVAQALPVGLVDVIVGGHTHKAVAHRVHGIAVIESWALGRAFGRVDLTLENGQVVDQRIFPPRDLCTATEGTCVPGEYEGEAVVPSAEVAAVVEPALAAAEARRREPLGVTLAEPLRRAYRDESALGNWLADLMHEIRPEADAALLNAGGVRADLDAGPLTYGQLYEAFPFDNRFATVELSGAQLARIVAFNLQHSSGTLILAGLTARARCRGDELVVELRDRHGRRVTDGQRLKVVTSDYLATTPLFEGLPSDAVQLDGSGTPIREAIAARLRERGGIVRPSDVFDPERPRLRLPMPRPVRCE